MNRVNTIFKVLKMLLNSWKTTAAVYLGIAFFVNAYVAFSLRSFQETGDATHSGITIANIIFIFILVIASFTECFRLTMSMNVSRRTFFYSEIIAIVTLSFVLALLDLGAGSILTLLTGMRFNHILHQILVSVAGQNYESYINEFTILAFNTSFLFLAATSGWLIRMLYYRANKLQQIVLSFSPILLYSLLYILLYDSLRPRLENYNLYRAAIYIGENFFRFIHSILFDTLIHFVFVIIILSIFASVSNLFLCYLLIRRAAVR